jgi:hypothetical protein
VAPANPLSEKVVVPLDGWRAPRPSSRSASVVAKSSSVSNSLAVSWSSPMVSTHQVVSIRSW